MEIRKEHREKQRRDYYQWRNRLILFDRVNGPSGVTEPVRVMCAMRAWELRVGLPGVMAKPI